MRIAAVEEGLNRRSLEGHVRIGCDQRLLELRKDLPNRCTAMTHCVLLLIEKLGNRSAVWKQEESVVPKALASTLMVKDSTGDHSLAGPNDPIWRCDGDGAHEARFSIFFRDPRQRGKQRFPVPGVVRGLAGEPRGPHSRLAAESCNL